MTILAELTELRAMRARVRTESWQWCGSIRTDDIHRWRDIEQEQHEAYWPAHDREVLDQTIIAMDTTSALGDAARDIVLRYIDKRLAILVVEGGNEARELLAVIAAEKKEQK